MRKVVKRVYVNSSYDLSNAVQSYNFADIISVSIQRLQVDETNSGTGIYPTNEFLLTLELVSHEIQPEKFVSSLEAVNVGIQSLKDAINK